MYIKKAKRQFLLGRVRKLPNVATVSVAAAILKVPGYSLYNWIKTKGLPVVDPDSPVIEIEKRSFVRWAVENGYFSPKYARQAVER